MRRGKQGKAVATKPRQVSAGPEVEAARSRLLEAMELPLDERAAALPDLVQVAKDLSPQNAESLLQDVARAGQEAAIPLLEALADEADYAPAAVEAMGFIRSQAVAPILQEIAASDRLKPVLKASRRAIHRLRTQGIEIEEAPAGLPAEIGLIGGRRIIESKMTSIDGSGTQVLSLVFTTPLSGTEVFEAVCSDTKGIVDAVGVKTTKREYAAHIEEMKQTEPTVTYADIPADYLISLARDYERIAEEQDKALPTDYHMYRDLFRPTGREYTESIVYDEIDLDAVKSNPSLAENADPLFAKAREFATWVAPEEQIRPYAEQMMEADESALVLSDTAKEDRIDRIISSATEEVFTPEVRARYKRRLEENAYVLLKTDRRELAEIAVASALQLAPDGPPATRVAFARTLVERSIGFYIYANLDQEEPRIYRAEGG